MSLRAIAVFRILFIQSLVLRSQAVIVRRDGFLPRSRNRRDAHIQITQQVRREDDFLPFSVPPHVWVFTFAVGAVVGGEQMRACGLALE